MTDKKHIDRLFQEKLKNFEATPNDAVWDNIHATLHDKDKRNRRVIPIWWKLAGVAALIALLLTVGIQLFPNDSNSNVPNSVVDTETQSSETENASESNSNNTNDRINEVENSSQIVSEDTSNKDERSNRASTESSKSNQNNRNASDAGQNRVVDNSVEKTKETNASEESDRNSNSILNSQLNTTENTVADIQNNNQKTSFDTDARQKKEVSDMDKLINNSKNDINSAVTDNTSDKENLEQSEDKKKQTIENAIAEANTNDEEEEEEENKKLNRWSIAPNVAPVYFNTLGKGSTLDEQFVDNANSSEVTISYGVGGSYAINERLKVRAGINKVNLGYSTNNVIAFRNIEASSFATSGNSSNSRAHLTNVDMNSSSENMIFLSTETFNRSITPEIINSKSSGSIKQRFGFIEVPLEMEYALINKKFGVNVIGGFSTFIVDENEIYSVFDGAETNIGEANNINGMSYSANFGLGINYNISENIKVNLEPTFKYQINTFTNSSGDFQPFFIGVYTGLSYKF